MTAPDEQATLDAYDRLRQDPEEWAAYLEELRQTGHCCADGLESAYAEYPEYQKRGARP